MRQLTPNERANLTKARDYFRVLDPKNFNIRVIRERRLDGSIYGCVIGHYPEIFPDEFAAKHYDSGVFEELIRLDSTITTLTGFIGLSINYIFVYGYKQQYGVTPQDVADVFDMVLAGVLDPDKSPREQLC